MLHKVTYASVLKRDRLEQHRLVAEWLVARSGERAREYFGVIADHFEKAGDAANAVAYLRKAADDAARTYALEAAIAYFDRALALIHDSRERFDVLTARTHAVFETRDLGLQERCVQDLESAAEELDDDLLHALAASFRTTHCARTGELAAAAEAASRALAHAERSGNTAAAIRAHNQWGYALAVGGEYAAARGQAELGLAMARSAGSWTGEASALNLLGYIAHELGRYDTARRHLHGALELARDRQDRGFEFRVRCSLAGNDLRIGHNARATAELHAALEAFDGLGWREYEAQVTGRLALAAHLRGDAEEALSWIERAVALDPGAKNPDFQAWLGMLRGEVHALLGQHDAAEACLLEAEAAYRALGNPLAAIEAQAGLARLALAAGDLTLARERIGAATARIDAGWRGGIVGDALLVMWTCHRVLSALGDPRAPTYLGVAHAALQERADMLGPGDRDVFLALATHVAIGAAWGREQRSAT
jgi:tetratricopeptide (TPR) repeat protein